MAYNLVITDQAQEHIDQIIDYVMFHLENPLAASAIIDDIEESYHQLEEHAEVFGYSEDSFLASKGYRKLKLRKHDYVVLYRVDKNNVFISGVFHTLENYQVKI